MSYRIQVVSSDRYLHLRVEGENSTETVAAYMAETAELCRELGHDSVLLEEHLTGPSLDPLEIYQVSAGAVPGFASLRRMAYVDTVAEHDAGLMEFAETVAVNRGGHVQVFRTVEEARAWMETEIAKGERASRQ